MSLKTIGANLKTLRERERYTQRDLADSAGLAHSHVGILERGEVKDVELGTLLKLAEALGVKVAQLDPDLLGATPDPDTLTPYKRAELAFVLLSDNTSAARTWVRVNENRVSTAYEQHTSAEWLRLIEAQFIRDRSGQTRAESVPVPELPPLPIQVETERKRAAKKRPGR